MNEHADADAGQVRGRKARVALPAGCHRGGLRSRGGHGGSRRARCPRGCRANRTGRAQTADGQHVSAAATWLDGLARRGGLHRDELERGLAAVLDQVVPAVVEEVLRRLDLVEIVERHVDLDRIISQVDLDSAVSRVDLDAVVSRVDIDAVASRLDIDAVVTRVDLNEIVRQRVDLDGLVATVDLDAVAARLDIEAVIDRVNVVGLAMDVIAEIDLPEIIRESTGSMASDTLRGVRMQSISGDDAIGRVVNRLRMRRARPASTTTNDDGSPVPGDTDVQPAHLILPADHDAGEQGPETNGAARPP